MAELDIGITVCFICLRDKDIIIDKRLNKKKKQLTKNMLIDFEPCNKCKELMKDNIIFVITEDGKSFNGSYIGVKKESEFIKNNDTIDFSRGIVFINRETAYNIFGEIINTGDIDETN